MSRTRRSILLVTPEATPFAKTGGLADVAGALPLALGRLGHRVTVVLPRYRLTPAGRPVGQVSIALGPDRLVAVFGEHVMAETVRAIVVECPELYDREHLYGAGTTDYADNARRFAFLARAALEWPAVARERPDVIHAHDWQTGLTGVYAQRLYAHQPAVAGVPVVFTIHNLAYQGIFAAEWLAALDLPVDTFHVDGLEFWGRISFLKAGINYAALVTTVSPTYAREIQTEEFGCGFDGILRQRASRLVGILNGIDVERWNPATDRHLPVTYDEHTLERKREVKRALHAALDLPADAAALDRPTIGMVSRMVDQKGFDLLERAAERLLGMPATIVLLGSGDPRYEALWTQLARTQPSRLAVRIGFDDGLAHLIIGGADLFLMPSRFEPCGLSQLYCLRYGTIPVVRATGGLDDTIEDWDPVTGGGTGFKFDAYSPAALLAALERALEIFQDPLAWRRLQRAGMARDYSWAASAAEYARVYERAIRSARGERRRSGT